MEPIVSPADETLEGSAITIDSYLQEGQERSLADDVLDGLDQAVQGAPTKALL